MHIVCFAPYTNWSIHSAREVTILQALRLRGCSVSYIACDAAYDVCDMTQKSTGSKVGPGPQTCLACQSSVAARLAAWGMPYRWMGRWLQPGDAATVDAWIATLTPSAFPAATYDATADGRPDGEPWKIGAWARSSVHTYLRHQTLDLTDTAVQSAYVSNLRVGLLTAFALSRLFAAERPTSQLLFNGRMAPTRVALELAKLRGIRTLVEERGTVDTRITLFEDTHCFDLKGFDALWRQWRHTPLAAGEIAQLAKLLTDRWYGRSRDISAFSAGAEEKSAVFARLKLDPARPLWVLYTSSLDETLDEEHGAAFPDQGAWIKATLVELQRRPDVQLVIRVHPNAGSRRSLGRNPQDAALFAALSGTLPDNVRLVPSDEETSSYTLAGAAQLGLVWHSTIGLEMAAAHRPVVNVGGGWLADCDAMFAAATADAYSSAVAAALSTSDADLERRTVQAWRFATVWFFRFTLPFPLVRQTAWFLGEPAYTDVAELAPGRDAAMDRICATLMHGTPLFDDRAPAGGDASAERAAILQHARAFRGSA